MWAVVGHALAARRGQSVVTALVALLAATAVTVAPWYATAAARQAGVAAVETAPIGERLISTAWEPQSGAPTPPDHAAAFGQTLASAFTSVSGAVAPAEARHGDVAVAVTLAYREAMCEHVTVTGACPAAPGEVALPGAMAGALGLEPGDELPATRRQTTGASSVTDVPVVLLVVGVYEVVDAGDPYWADGSLAGLGEGTATQRQTVLTPLASLTGSDVTFIHDLVAVPHGFADADLPELTARLSTGLSELERQGHTVTSGGVETLIDQIVRDRQQVIAGTGVGVAVLLVLTWFALGVMLREAIAGARGDLGWARLHGLPPARAWLLLLAQSTIPLLAGALAGSAAGIALGGAAAGTTGSAGDRGAMPVAVALAGLTIAGGLVAAVVAQFSELRAPVHHLLRSRPSRRRRSVLDLVLVVLTVVAVGQALAVGRAGNGLALAAPPLAALALVVVASWAVPRVASRLASRALRAGRLPAALVTASMARRTSTRRLFVLVGVAVALATTTVIGWDTAGRTNEERARLEAGADRVITVAAADPARLVAAVRAVDPSGTMAMATMHRAGSGDLPPVLAVDSTRLGPVAGWSDDYGGTVDDVAAALRPDTPAPVVLETDRLEIEAASSDTAGGAVRLGVMLRSILSGEPVEAVVGPLATSAGVHVADVPCASGCRLVGIQVLGDAGSGRAVSGTWVVLSRLGGAGETATEALVSDPSRWRPALGPVDLGLTITADGAGLRLAVPPPGPGGRADQADQAFVADTPAPLPAVAAGWQPDPVREVRLAPLAGIDVPLHVASRTDLLPRLGATGVLTDLENAQRLDPSAAGSTGQVWLTSSAPDSIVDDLRAAGLTPLRQDSLAERRDRLDAQGGTVGARFQAAVAVLGLLLVAGALLVHAAQGRRGQVAELAALRIQGVGRATARAAAYGAPATVIGAASLVGVVVGGGGAALARRLHPGFVDGWAELPAAAMRPAAVLAVAALVAIALGGVAAFDGLGTARRTEGAVQGRPT